MNSLVQVHRENIAKLTPVIGTEAARLVVKGNEYLAAMFVVLVFGAIPTGLWYGNGGPGFPCALAWLLGLGSGSAALKFSRKGDRLASACVSKALGYPVTLRGGGTNAGCRRRRIDRAQAARTTHSPPAEVRTFTGTPNTARLRRPDSIAPVISSTVVESVSGSLREV